ncbi:MAG: hypothetical protein JWM16_2420 [Verrucomicrobiales bacterium]|nr:hypothetical protein [Verrucomicrobiales bacterium]
MPFQVVSTTEEVNKIQGRNGGAFALDLWAYREF